MESIINGIMLSDHIKTKHKIKEISSISSFNELIDSCMLTDEDKKLLRLHYLKGKDFRYIADILGFSESAIKKRHKKALQKINKLL